MNTAKKGYIKEYRIRKQLEKEGWFIPFKSIRNRFGCIDFANLFDVVAFKGKQRRYISSKHTNGGNYYKPHQQEIINFKQEYGYDGEEFELWLWKDYKKEPLIIKL